MKNRWITKVIFGLIILSLTKIDIKSEVLSLSSSQSDPAQQSEDLGNGIIGSFTSLVVPAGSSVELVKFSSSYFGNQEFYIVTSNDILSISSYHGLGRKIINGPVTLKFKTELNSEPQGLLYSLIPSQPFRSVIIKPGTTSEISVPIGKKITFLGIMGKLSGSSGAPAVGSGIIINGISFYFQSGEDFPFSLSGPLSIALGVQETGQGGGVFVYSLSSDFVDMASSGYIQNTVGSLELVIENSIDLINWSPLIVKEISSQTSGREFYRIRVSQ
jgi:hypothetical protein